MRLLGVFQTSFETMGMSDPASTYNSRNIPLMHRASWRRILTLTCVVVSMSCAWWR
ncbi:unnamed protein product [Hymenolepis diminuta]|uniref:Uncharacterized protein n=1 Tax=Hymenolepis diminuta TaxID=6216 RepID=A0A564XXN6_HYMDI|nr:unnamed protein product [Hymenolepis diminuta]